MSATFVRHDSIVAEIRTGGGREITELRCMECGVKVQEWPIAAWKVQTQIREAWQRHITPPAEGDYQI